MSRSKDKGTAWETETVRTLQRHGGLLAERRALHGTTDRGDVSGIPGVVIEDKAEARQDIPGWLTELQVEMVNDGADIGLVWAKRVGKTSALDGYMILPPIVGLRLLARAGYIDGETDWLVTKEAEQGATGELDALLDGEAETLALIYHAHVCPLAPEHCSGTLDCPEAASLDLDAFRVIAEVTK